MTMDESENIYVLSGGAVVRFVPKGDGTFTSSSWLKTAGCAFNLVVQGGLVRCVDNQPHGRFIAAPIGSNTVTVEIDPLDWSPSQWGGAVADSSGVYLSLIFGGAAETFRSLDGPGEGPSDDNWRAWDLGGYLATNSSALFWTGSTATSTPYIAMGLKSSTGNISFTKVVVPSDGLVTPGRIAADDTNVYWIDTANNTVSQIAIAGSQAIVLASHQNNPRSIAVSGGYVYWTNDAAGSGQIMRTPVATSASSVATPTQLVGAQANPQDIAVGSKCVYWTNAGDGTVNAAAK